MSSFVVNEPISYLTYHIYGVIDNITEKYKGTKIRILFYVWIKITGIIIRQILNHFIHINSNYYHL